MPSYTSELQREVAQEMAQEIDQRVVKRYEVEKCIGKGAYGVVWRALERRTREPIALKKCFDAFKNPTDAQRTYREVSYLLQLRGHDNIIGLSVVLKADNGQDLYLVFDLMQTDLHAAIRGGVLEEKHKQYVTHQTLRALAYLHSADVVHRDLKPANMLLDGSCRMKLCDFGLARSASETAAGAPDPYKHVEMTDYVATRWYTTRARDLPPFELTRALTSTFPSLVLTLICTPSPQVPRTRDSRGLQEVRPGGRPLGSGLHRGRDEPRHAALCRNLDAQPNGAHLCRPPHALRGLLIYEP